MPSSRWPWTSIVILLLTPIIAFALWFFDLFPLALLVSVFVAIEIVFLTHAAQKISREMDHRRRFALSLWALHHEMTNHFELQKDRESILQSGPELEKDEKSDMIWVYAMPIDQYLTTEWNRFREAGGLQDLLDYAHQQTAADLIRYYHGAWLCNENIQRRAQLLDRLLDSSGSEHQSVLETVRFTEDNIAAWVKEAPLHFIPLMQELQIILVDFKLVPAMVIAQVGADDKIRSLQQKHEEKYYRWREKHRLPRVKPSAVKWLRPTKNAQGHTKQRWQLEYKLDPPR